MARSNLLKTWRCWVFSFIIYAIAISILPVSSRCPTENLILRWRDCLRSHCVRLATWRHWTIIPHVQSASTKFAMPKIVSMSNLCVTTSWIREAGYGINMSTGIAAYHITSGMGVQKPSFLLHPMDFSRLVSPWSKFFSVQGCVVYITPFDTLVCYPDTIQSIRGANLGWHIEMDASDRALTPSLSHTSLCRDLVNTKGFSTVLHQSPEEALASLHPTPICNYAALLIIMCLRTTWIVPMCPLRKLCPQNG